MRDPQGLDVTVRKLSLVQRGCFSVKWRGKMRVARFQWSWSRLRRGSACGYFDLPCGPMYLCAAHWLDWAMLFGGMEQANVAWMRKEFAGATLMWDVGGHHGEYSLAMAQTVAPSGSVDVFEAFPPSAEVIRKTILANDLLERVRIHAVAVAAQRGEVELNLSKAGSQNHSLVGWVEPSGDQVAVPSTTLDCTMDAVGVPDFVKIDIEGGELGALLGAPRLLAERRTVFLIESELWDVNREAVHRLFCSAGYALAGLERGREREASMARMIVARPPW